MLLSLVQNFSVNHLSFLLSYFSYFSYLSFLIRLNSPKNIDKKRGMVYFVFVELDKPGRMVNSFYEESP